MADKSAINAEVKCEQRQQSSDFLTISQQSNGTGSADGQLSQSSPIFASGV